MNGIIFGWSSLFIILIIMRILTPTVSRRCEKFMFPKCGLELIGTNEVVDVRRPVSIFPKLPAFLGWVEIALPGCIKQSDGSSPTVSRFGNLN